PRASSSAPSTTRRSPSTRPPARGSTRPAPTPSRASGPSPWPASRDRTPTWSASRPARSSRPSAPPACSPASPSRAGQAGRQACPRMPPPARRHALLPFAVALDVRLAVVAWAAARFPPAADATYYQRIAERISQGLGYTWLWPDGAVTYAAHYPVG